MKRVQEGHKNTLYLVVALSMIFMTLVLAIQPLYLRNVLNLGRDNAGFVNANIQVLTEVVDLLLVGYLGYLSDRFGRIPLMLFGFLLAGAAAFLTPFSKEIGLFLGVNGLVVYYLVRTVMSLGTTAIWPQVATLTGDYTDTASRPQFLANVGFMMAFGATLVYAVFMQFPKHVGITVVMMLPVAAALAGYWLTRNYLLEVAPRLVGVSFPFRRVWLLLKKERGLRLSFLAAFSSRNDMIIIGLFLMTWFIYFADLLPGVSHAHAAGQAGVVIGFIGLVVLATIPVWGWIIARFGRVPALTLGLCLSGAGFTAMGLIYNPLSWWTLVPAFLVGLGQAGCLLAPQTLALDFAPEEIRGSVMGAFNTVGCLGIVFFLQVGGFLFDWASPTAPFIFTGIANLAIMGYGLAILHYEDKESSQYGVQGN